jgi:hypothetical protein
VRLFRGADYEENVPTDHLFRDQLRSLCTVDLPEDEPLTIDYFRDHIVGAAKHAALFDFFAGFSKACTPLRWDRIIVVELLLMAFLDTLGFAEFHKSTKDEFCLTALELETDVVRDNARWWIPQLELPPGDANDKLESALRQFSVAAPTVADAS